MKLKKIFYMALLFSTTMSQAQNCWDVVNTPTTDWRQYNGTTNKNNWNWTDTAVQTFVLPSTVNNVQIIERRLPYYCIGFGTGGCNNDNTDRFHNVNDPKEVDVQPEDGWELLIKKFGTVTDPVNDPYFVLYNRYTGRLRAFILLVDEFDAQNAEVKIGFFNDVSTKRARTTFSTSAAIIPLQDEFDNRINFIAPNHYIRNREYWVYADIATHYDPCTCTEPTKLSRISVNVFSLSSLSVNLDINGVITEQIIDNNIGIGGIDGKPAISSIGDLWRQKDAISEAAKTGYDKWDKTNQAIVKYTDKANPYIKDYLIKQWWKREVLDNPQAQNYPEDSMRAWFERFKVLPKATQVLLGFKDVDKLDNATKAIKGIAKGLPYVGAALSLIDFFTAGGGETQKAAESRAPMIQAVNLKATGTISNVTPEQGFNFHLPGYSNANSNAFTPYYNNTLGVMSLIDMPKFNYRESGFQMSKPHFQILFNKFYASGRNYDNTGIAEGKIAKNNIDWGTPWIYNYVLTVKQYEKDELTIPDLPALLFKPTLFNDKVSQAAFNGSDPDYTSDWKVRSYKLTEDLTYAVNPASKLELTSMDASIILDYHISLISDTLAIFDSSYTTYGEYSFPFVKRQPRNKEDWFTLLEEAGMEVEYVPNYWKDSALIRIRTPFVPVNMLKNQSILLWNGDTKPKAYIKMYSRLKRKDNPTADPVVYLLTYDITSKFFGGVETGNGNVRINAISGNLSFPYWMADPSYRFNGTPTQAQIDASQTPLMRIWSFTHMKDYNVTFPEGSIFPHTVFDGIPEYKVFNAGDVITGYVVAKHIIINSGVIISNGAVVHGVKSVDINSTNVINPTATIFAGDYFEHFDRTTTGMHANGVQIGNLCNSTQYKNKTIWSSPPPDKQNDSTLKDNKVLDCKVFPNPNNGAFQVLVKSNEELEDFEISLFEMTGREVMQQTVNGEFRIINITTQGLSGGVYFLQVKSGYRSFTNKILINHNH